MTRAIQALLCSLATLAACTDDDPDPTTAETASEIAGCSGTAFSLYGQLCGVGVSAAGKPAVLFRNQWFQVDYNGGNWALANSVAAAETAVAPQDHTTDSRPACIQSCPPDCPPNPMMECQFGIYDACVEQCSTYYELEESRRFTWSVAGSTYSIQAIQTVSDQHVVNGGYDLRIASQAAFVLTVNDPVDNNLWTVGIHPIRTNSGAGDQNAANWQVTEPSTTITNGVSGELFTPPTVNVFLQPNVELMSAVKTASAGATEMVANANPAMNRALDTALPQGSSFQNHLEPQAIQAFGSVLGRVPGVGASTGSYDLQRFAQFYMDDRRGHSGFSETGTGQRPLAQSTKQQWRFRHTIFDYQLHFPFLAGICGFDVFVNSYIAGALDYGRIACFDGLATNVDLAGNLEFALKGGGGFGCNIFVASASAGMNAGVKAAAEFSTQLRTATVPPSVHATVDIYSQLEYAAHFKVRVLFWTKKWEKILGVRRIFQKSASFDLAARSPIPAIQLCTDDGSTAGTCPDPASCDVTGRCIRYDFTGGGDPARVDMGTCFYPPEQNVRLDFEGSCDFLRACSGPSQGQQPPNVNFQCTGIGECRDAELWVAAPKKGLCSRNVRICLADDPQKCVTAVVKDLSNATRWEGSVGVFNALGLAHTEDRTRCTGTGRATVHVTPL